MLDMPRIFVTFVLILALPVVSVDSAMAQALTSSPSPSVTGMPQQTPSSTDAANEPTIPQSADYRIRQGDDLNLAVYGEPTLSPNGVLRVLPGGSIAVPLIGNVKVAGMTTAGASRSVASKLRRYLRDPKVTVAVVHVGLVEALILGNVKSPGKYVLSPPTKLTDVIAAAGGLGPTDGDLPEARLEDPDGSIRKISLQRLLHDGDTSLNLKMGSGEIVYIPSPIVFSVRVIGAVDKPGDVSLHEGDDLAMAIARAGTSTNSAADLNHVVVTRTDPVSGKAIAREVNLYEILKQGDLSHDIKMEKNDLVYVPQSGRRDGQRAFDPLSILRRFVGF
ncbi:MAG: hypothetical protein NVSMB64_10090 [Candidatus Velthaea sp.]